MEEGEKLLDEIFAEVKQWHDEHPWLSRYYRLRRWVRNGVHTAKRQPRIWWQHIRQGYSYRDLWSFDTYIAGVIGRATEELKGAYGCPSDMSEEEWMATLARISEPLLAYSKGKFLDLTREQELAQYDAAREAMHLFAGRLGDMWD